MKEKEFPIYKPHRKTLSHLTELIDFEPYKRLRYKALRNAAGFIHRKEVRKIIMYKCNNKCMTCGSTENLTIDHIISVWRFANEKLPYELLNTYDNLQILCLSCNSSKHVGES